MTTYRLIDKDGKEQGEFRTAAQAAFAAKTLWPDQQQDEDRKGLGWDVEVVPTTD